MNDEEKKDYKVFKMKKVNVYDGRGKVYTVVENNSNLGNGRGLTRLRDGSYVLIHDGYAEIITKFEALDEILLHNIDLLKEKKFEELKKLYESRMEVVDDSDLNICEKESVKKKFDNFTFVYEGYTYNFIDGMKKPSDLSWKKYFDKQDSFDYQDLIYIEVEQIFDIDENTLLIFYMVMDPTWDTGRISYIIKENGKFYLVYPHGGNWVE